MCTVMVRHNPADPHPIAILANRDEAYDRPAGGWDWRGSDRQYFAPIDELAGGSWVGINRSGLVVALTNIFPNAELENPRSRGALVADALGYQSVALAEDELAPNISGSTYNNFNLLIADPIAAIVLGWNNGALSINRLQPGQYEIVNTPFAPQAVGNLDSPNKNWLTKNEVRLATHPDICRHGDKYGTRCSHKILVGRAGTEKHVWHLEGPPCRGKFVHILEEG